MVEGTSVMKRICTAMQSYSLVILWINNKATWDLCLKGKKKRKEKNYVHFIINLVQAEIIEAKEAWEVQRQENGCMIHIALHMYMPVCSILCARE